MSHNQPGPYGQYPPQGPPPGQPGPYGAPQGGGYGQPAGPNPYSGGGGSPAYGYPQQPAPPGPPSGGYPGQPGQPGQPGAYAAPGQPAPYGQPGPYGQPPYGGGMPPAGGGGRGGRNAGLLIGAAVVVAALVAGGIVLFGGSDDEGGGGGVDYSSDVAYRLELPETQGDFTLTAPAQNTSDADPERLAEMGLQNAQGTQATYMAGISVAEAEDLQGPDQLGDQEVTVLFVAGLWGAVDDPATSVDALFAYGASQGGDITLLGEPQEVSPDGADGAVMKCQYAETQDQFLEGQTVQVPVCAWADDSTLGFIVAQRMNGQGDVEVSVEEAAQLSADMRAASLVPDEGGSGTDA
ncbi:hypothetical protein [Streptomyces sp. RFCAC02]|uniref:hypothetical protein n=1 Tax=Streptomyces sp. RFCAC02 TaxID=2499143 RepID=UPI00102216B9|nr:hypothetical protein [Streptomyces sp. RFCAC02]